MENGYKKSEKIFRSGEHAEASALPVNGMPGDIAN